MSIQNRCRSGRDACPAGLGRAGLILNQMKHMALRYERASFGGHLVIGVLRDNSLALRESLFSYLDRTVVEPLLPQGPRSFTSVFMLTAHLYSGLILVASFLQLMPLSPR